MKKQFSKHLFISIILLFITVGTFWIPMVINIANHNIVFDPIIIIPLTVIVINVIPLIFLSELMKTGAQYNDLSEFRKDFSWFYRLLIANNGKRRIIECSCLVTIILTILDFVIFGNLHIKGIVFHNICVCIAYISGVIAFYYPDISVFQYRKRDYFFYRSFLLMSLPLCSSIYLVELINNQLEYVTLPLIICIASVIYSLITYKKWFVSKRLYAAVVSLVFFILITLYAFFGVNNNTILLRILNDIVFALEFAVYAYLLTTLIYSNVAPNKSEKSKHSIEKLQVSLFNFAPVFSITLLIGLMDTPYILFSFAIINILATVLVGSKKSWKNCLFILLLLSIFILLSIYTFSHNSDYTINLKSPITWISPLFAIVFFIIGSFTKPPTKIVDALNNNNYLRKNKAYYVTGVISNLLLLLITAIIEWSSNATKKDFYSWQVVLYVVTTTGIMFFRAFIGIAKKKDEEELKSK